jgi:hypothetical protein
VSLLVLKSTHLQGMRALGFGHAGEDIARWWAQGDACSAALGEAIVRGARTAARAERMGHAVLHYLFDQTAELRAAKAEVRRALAGGAGGAGGRGGGGGGSGGCAGAAGEGGGEVPEGGEGCKGGKGGEGGEGGEDHRGGTASEMPYLAMHVRTGNGEAGEAEGGLEHQDVPSHLRAHASRISAAGLARRSVCALHQSLTLSVASFAIASRARNPVHYHCRIFCKMPDSSAALCDVCARTHPPFYWRACGASRARGRGRCAPVACSALSCFKAAAAAGAPPPPLPPPPPPPPPSPASPALAPRWLLATDDPAFARRMSTESGGRAVSVHTLFAGRLSLSAAERAGGLELSRGLHIGMTSPASARLG